MAEYNIYCDESCYLQNDHFNVMGFGCICVPKEKSREISLQLKEIKNEFHCTQELKWTKVSPKNLDFYHTLVDYFFDCKDLAFRALVVENKDSLDHETYNLGSHDSFYYKMYYQLLKNIVDKRNSGDTFNVYFDIKDRHSSFKIKKLQEVLTNYLHDFDATIITKMQIIRSNESELLQLNDFLLGSVMYKSRHFDTSAAKLSIVGHVENKSGSKLDYTNEPWKTKFNLFHFMPSFKREN
ncbi:MAG: DUF3800 domain-containing protein [archaeon]|nr:DUF3800 domain-containing protein [archaeon]